MVLRAVIVLFSPFTMLFYVSTDYIVEEGLRRDYFSWAALAINNDSAILRLFIFVRSTFGTVTTGALTSGALMLVGVDVVVGILVEVVIVDTGA